MAKIVKFNLKFGEDTIRTLEDLQNNFSLQDVLEHFEHGLLQKFLERRGYKEEAENVKNLKADKDLDEIKKAQRLLEIFEVSEPKEAVDEAIESLRYRSEREQRFLAYTKNISWEQHEVDSYFERYEGIVKRLIEQNGSLGIIRENTKELLDFYKPILEKDFGQLLQRLTDNKALYPVLHMLTHEFFRSRWHTTTEESKLPQMDAFKIALDEAIDKAGKEETLPWIKLYNRDSEDRWEDVEKDGNEYMIISAHYSARVRSFGSHVQEDVSGNELNNKYKTFNGIQYRCSARIVSLLYVEV